MERVYFIHARAILIKRALIRYGLSVLFLLLLQSKTLLAATEETDSLLHWKIGIGVDYAIDYHQCSLRSLPGVPSCAPIISGGKGSALGLRGFVALPIRRGLVASLGIGYVQRSGLLSTSQQVLVDARGAQEATIQYSIAADLAAVTVHPELQYSVGAIVVHTGFNIGLLTKTQYEQAERILAPATIMFENDRRDRMNFAGTIDRVAPFFSSLTIGLSSSFKLHTESRWTIEPKLMYAHMIGNLLRTADPWVAHSIGIGLSLCYSRQRDREIVRPTIEVEPEPVLPPVPPIAVVPKPKLLFPELQFVPRLRDSNNTEMDLQFVVRNTISQNTYAMINYVFFDSASSKLAWRYKTLSTDERKRFTATELNATSTMEIYYNILNLVGYRMSLDQRSRIALIGCNSGVGSEKNNIVLSKARAESVKSYLCNTWGINASRITISARNLPEAASNSSTEDGIEENRRVEIRTEFEELLEPLIFSDTACALNAAKVLYPGNVNTEISVSSWLLSVVSNDKIITSLGDRGTPPDEIVWDTEIDREQIRQAKGTLKAILKVIDTDGREYSAESDAMEIKQQRVRNSTIQRFSLITFAFNASNVSRADRRILEIIKQHILPKSVVHVTGYTDRVGDPEHNQQLSEERAKQVAKLLNIKGENAKGEGASNPLYDNSTPEGRFYSRTVIVTIETPID